MAQQPGGDVPLVPHHAGDASGDRGHVPAVGEVGLIGGAGPVACGERDLEPGRVERFELDLWVTSNLFKPGHRVRLEVSSSNFPRFDRNPNSGQPFGSDTTPLARNVWRWKFDEFAQSVMMLNVLT